MKQTAIRLEEPGRFASVSEDLTDPQRGEARVRIRCIGVCGTDIHAFHGRQPFFEYPRILGHELAAEVVSINGDSDLEPGQLVAVEPYLNDPTSPASKRGMTNCCESLQVLGVHCDGGMRPEINVPSRKLHPSSLNSPDQLALVEMLGIGHHAVNRSRCDIEDTALILGAGPIGLSVLSFLRLKTRNLIVADLDESRLAFCREAFGVERTIQISPGEPITSALLEATGGNLPDIIFDATGNAASMHTTFELIANGGRIVFVGLFQGDVAFHDPNFHRREITLLSSRNATSPEFSEVIRAIETGAIDTAPWITHRMNLGNATELFATTIADKNLRKAVISQDD